MAHSNTVVPMLVISVVMTLLISVSVGFIWLNQSLTPAQKKQHVPPAVLIVGFVCLFIILCAAQIALQMSYSKLWSSQSN